MYDLIATATAFTACQHCRCLPAVPARIPRRSLFAAAARNPRVGGMLRESLRRRPVRIMDELGIDADAKEAVSFALLAVRTIRGQSGNVPRHRGQRPGRAGKGGVGLGPCGSCRSAAHGRQPEVIRDAEDRSRLTTEKPQPRQPPGLTASTPWALWTSLIGRTPWWPRPCETQRVPIAQAIDIIVESFRRGGRLFYVGAGTSGRLGRAGRLRMSADLRRAADAGAGHHRRRAAGAVRSVEGAEDSPAGARPHRPQVPRAA